MFCEYVWLFERQRRKFVLRSGPAAPNHLVGERAGSATACISRAGKGGDTIEARPQVLLFNQVQQFFLIPTAFSVSTGRHLIYIMVSNHSLSSSASSHIY
jgi:hypothetical protein